MTTPTAAPAAPVAAAPAAPVVPVPAAPAAPAAAPVAAAPAAPAAIDSLLPADPGAAPAAPAAAPVAPAAPVDPNSPNAWVLAEGVLGNGEKPSWFKNDKYASVAKQAEAYTALESRFGSFVGAPKDGRYEFKAPEGVAVDIKNDHPLITEFTTWAGKNQLSQDGYNTLLGMMAQYEASQLPNMTNVKAQLGENADTRIQAVAAWGKANLGPEGYATFREATSGANAAAVFKVVEAVVAKTKQVPMPRVGGDLPAAQPGGLAAIKAAQGKVGPDGKTRLWDSSPAYRVEVEKQYADYFAAQGQG